MFDRARRSPYLRLFAIFAMLAANLAATMPTHAQAGVDSYDLVAMQLRVDDYDAAGLDGEIVRYNGTCLTLEEYVMVVAEGYGMEPAEFGAALEPAGFMTACEVYHGLPSQPEASSPPLMFFRSYAHQWEDEDGAAEGFAFLEDESTEPGHTDLPEGEGIGDESEATTWSGEDEGGAFNALDVSFRIADVTGGVTIFDYQGGTPDVELAVDLAEDMLDRVEDVMDGDGPGLGRMIAKMEGDGLPPAGTQRYEVLDGEAEPRVGETADEFADRLETYGDAPNVFFTGQNIPGKQEGARGYQYGVTVAEFGSDDDAVAYVETAIDRHSEDEENFDVTEREDAPQYGDASITLMYGSNANDTLSSLERLYVAIDNYVINMYFVGDIMPLGVTESVIETQIACVEDGGCDDTVQVPAALGGKAADETASPESGSRLPGLPNPSTPEEDEADEERAADDEDVDEGAANGNAYVSELYPYTIALDSDWELTETQVIEETEILSISNGTSGIVIIADTAHEGDVEACLDNALAYIEDDEEVDNVQTMRDTDDARIRGEEDGRAWEAISYETADGGEMALYVECIEIVPGEVTMEFNQFVPLDAFEDEVDARDDLLAGIEIGNQD